MFKRKRKIEGFQKIAFFFRLARARKRERENAVRSRALSLSLSSAFPTVFAVLFSRRHPRGRDTTIPPPTRIGEASTIGKRLLCSYKKREQRKDDDAFCAHASSSGRSRLLANVPRRFSPYHRILPRYVCYNFYSSCRSPRSFRPSKRARFCA